MIGMKFSKGTNRIILRSFLVLMVILSIVLSAYIWGSNSRLSRIEQNGNQTVSKEVGKKSLRNIYVPTQVFYYHKNQMYQVYDGENNLPLEFNKITDQLTKRAAHSIKSSAKEYQKLLHNKDYMQLTYPDQITMPLFLTDLNKKDNRKFNRFFVPINKSNSKYLYLGDDTNNQLYRIAIRNISFNKLVKHAKGAKAATPVSFIKLRDGYSVIYKNGPKMSVYSYLTSQETNSYFVYRLLGSDSPSQRTTDNAIIYSYENTQTLVASKKTHNYEFTDLQQNKVPKTMTQRLTDSLYYVRKIGLVDTNLRFFDADNEVFVYQNFVEEYPVFLPGIHNSRAQVKFSSNGIKINFNSLDFQVPVPSNGTKSTLQPTDQILQKLELAGYKKEIINRIIVGYAVKKDSQDKNNLVDLIPTYYVKINKKWMTVDEWLNVSKETSNQSSSEGLTDGL